MYYNGCDAISEDARCRKDMAACGRLTWKRQTAGGAWVLRICLSGTGSYEREGMPAKRIYDQTVLSQLCQKAYLDTILDPQKIGFFGCVYKKGEYLCRPCEEEKYLQIVVDGQVSIYHIRDDGTKYSLTEGAVFSCWEIWNSTSHHRLCFLQRL